MHELLLRLEKPVQDAFYLALRNATSRAEIRLLAEAIVSGDLDTIMAAAGSREGMFSPLTESIRTAYAEGGTFALKVGAAKRLATEFDINNPRAEDWLRTRSSTHIKGVLLPEQRAAVQTMLEAGLFRGDNPRTTALDIVGRIGENGRRSGGVLGLNQPQTRAVIHMRDILENNPREYFIKNRVTGQMTPRFTLTDRRFNRTVMKAINSGSPIPTESINKIIGRYEDRLLKHRGDTIGRTETLRAINESGEEAMRQVIDDGLVPKDAITRIWRHSFSANERPGHLQMNGDERGMDEFFTNPVTKAILRFPQDPLAPPSETINCRCYIERKIDFIAVEKAA